MKIGTKSLAAVLASVLIGAVAATNLQQQATAFTDPWLKNFKKLTHEFEKGVIAAIEDPENIPEALNAYSLDVLRISSGDPNQDQVRTLLQGYEKDVTTIFDINPPDPDKQAKDFRGVTHDFEKAVIGLVQPPEPGTPA
jgi:archaellum component FlaG (FlaF/FlaG flagellin family)